jgi:hypothetical protein
MDEIPYLGTGVQTFSEFINEKMIYVDKTAYLSRMLVRKNKVLFLSRPRRFGKTLTVSTLESLLSGERELFKGLFVERYLDDKRFAPRPVIRLNMATLVLGKGVEGVESSLGRLTARIANNLGVTVNPDDSPNDMIRDLITNAAKQSGQRVAILIDEYDAPFVGFMNQPQDKMDALRETMRSYYATIKEYDKFISFIFVTGITKFAHIGLLSSFNTYIDISTAPEYGAILGFTHEELGHYYKEHIEQTAIALGMSEQQLSKKMEEYYNGFCFDGKTKVYNPFSTQLFLNKKSLKNFGFLRPHHPSWQNSLKITR